MMKATDRIHVGNGPLEFYVLTPDTVPDILKKCDEGFDSATSTLHALGQFLQAQPKTKRGDGCSCFMCEYEFHRRSETPTAFIAMMPMFPEAGDQGLLSPVCSDCFTRHQARFEEALIERVHKLWPGIGPLESIGAKQ